MKHINKARLDYMDSGRDELNMMPVTIRYISRLEMLIGSDSQWSGFLITSLHKSTICLFQSPVPAPQNCRTRPGLCAKLCQVAKQNMYHSYLISFMIRKCFA